jgi:hypothetical protein
MGWDGMSLFLATIWCKCLLIFTMDFHTMTVAVPSCPSCPCFMRQTSYKSCCCCCSSCVSKKRTHNKRTRGLFVCVCWAGEKIFQLLTIIFFVCSYSKDQGLPFLLHHDSLLTLSFCGKSVELFQGQP